MPVSARHADAVLARIEDDREELVDFVRELVRVPTVNPPGEAYEDGARLIGKRLGELGFEVDYIVPSDAAEHTPEHPRCNVVGELEGPHERPRLHFNGHFDVVPPGDGWTKDPFGGEIVDERIYGRGTADMKAGLVAAMYAAAAVRRAGVPLVGSVEVSGTVDEESGGFAGVAWLARSGRIHADRIDHVVIPEPFGPDRICTGHRGVYWFKVAAQGEIAHGSMPFLGTNAVDALTPLLEAFRTRLAPALTQRTTSMPVVPDEARRATLNLNSISGGQTGLEPQTPCVADHCEAIFDRRFLPEEGLERTRGEILDLVREIEAQDSTRRYTVTDLLVVEPVQAPPDSPLIAALERSIKTVLGRPPALVASPGTYDQKHISRLGRLDDCVAYGPGRLELAHRPDEYVAIDDLVASTRVMALTLLGLVGPEAS